MPAPLLSCWPVITERLGFSRRSQRAVSAAVRGSIDGRFLSYCLWQGGAEAIAALMKRYEDIHPQHTDVALVYLAGREKIETIFTLDGEISHLPIWT